MSTKKFFLYEDSNDMETLHVTTKVDDNGDLKIGFMLFGKNRKNGDAGARIAALMGGGRPTQEEYAEILLMGTHLKPDGSRDDRLGVLDRVEAAVKHLRSEVQKWKDGLPKEDAEGGE